MTPRRKTRRSPLIGAMMERMIDDDTITLLSSPKTKTAQQIHTARELAADIRAAVRSLNALLLSAQRNGVACDIRWPDRVVTSIRVNRISYDL